MSVYCRGVLVMVSRESEHLFDRETGAATSGKSDIRGSYEDRLNHILEAATRLIAGVGYAETSMRAVAREAGVSLAGLYHYFSSKEKMLFLIQFRTFSSLINTVQEKLHGVTDPAEQLRVMIRAHMAYFAANMAALKVCSHELESLTGSAYVETGELRRGYYDLARGIVDRLLDARAPDPKLDRHVATMCLFGTLNWLYRWYDPKRDRSPTTVANQVASQFLEGVLGANRGS